MPMKSEDEWRVEDDLRTLMRAEEVKKDPKRHKAALAKAKEKLTELQSLQADAKKST